MNLSVNLNGLTTLGLILVLGLAVWRADPRDIAKVIREFRWWRRK